MIRPRGPLGFVASVLAIWIAARSGAIYWLSGEAVRALPDRSAEQPPQRAAPHVAAAPPEAPLVLIAASTERPTAAPSVSAPARQRQALDHAALAAPPRSRPAQPATSEPILAPFPPALPRTPPTRRLSGATWLFVRDEGGPSLARAGQLGGSQAGLRLSYAVDRRATGALALYARASAPLEQSPGKEVAVGIDWAPAERIPLRLSVERRIGLDRGSRDAFAIGVVAGSYDIPLPAGLRLDVYGQAGMVGAQARDLYVDGSARIERSLLDTGGAELSLGGLLAGGAQPRVARLDAGPQLGVRFRAGDLPVRLNLDWRFRLAGNARPGSGPAVTLAADF